MPIYLVGGALRDVLIGFFSGRDFDFVVTGDFQGFVKDFSDKVKGKIIPWDFNQTRVVFREKGRLVSADFTQCRGKDILSDLKQRDFSINSIAVDLRSLMHEDMPVIIDPLDGKDDLENKMIRMSNPGSFDADPLRILRGIRFARELDSTIERKTFHSMKRKNYFIKQVAQERIKQEFFTIFQLPQVIKSISELRDIGVFNLLIPELEAFASVAQGHPHQYNLMEHSLKTIDWLEKLLSAPSDLLQGYEKQIESYFQRSIEEAVTRRSLLMFVGLFHDMGKTVTREVANNRVTFHRHAKEGSRLNRSIAKRLGLGKRAQKIVEQVTENHMRLLQLSQLEKITERAKMRVLKDMEAVSLEVILLAIADAKATSNKDTSTKTVKKIQNLAIELAEIVLSFSHQNATGLFITGREIMEILGIPEGPKVGKILQEICDRERSGLINSKEDAIQWLRKRKK